jgi:hypothetical protein
MIGSLRRGVMKVSNSGFYLLFVPTSEKERVETELAVAAISIHGIAHHTIEDRQGIFVAVVKSESVEKLRSIAHTSMTD